MTVLAQFQNDATGEIFLLSLFGYIAGTLIACLALSAVLSQFAPNPFGSRIPVNEDAMGEIESEIKFTSKP